MTQGKLLCSRGASIAENAACHIATRKETELDQSHRTAPLMEASWAHVLGLCEGLRSCDLGEPMAISVLCIGSTEAQV